MWVLAFALGLVRRHEVHITPTAALDAVGGGRAPSAWCSSEALAGCRAFSGGDALPPEALADRLLVGEALVARLYERLWLKDPTCDELCDIVAKFAGPTLAPPGVACGDPDCKERATLRRSELVPSDAVPLDDEQDGDEDEVEGDADQGAEAGDRDEEEELWEHVLSLFGMSLREEQEAVLPAAEDGVTVSVRRARRSSRGPAIQFGRKIDASHKPLLKLQREQAVQSLEVAIDALGARRPSETTLQLAQQYLGERTPEVLKQTVKLLKVARRAVGTQRFEACKPTTGSRTKAYVMVWRSGKKGDRHRKFLRSEKSGNYYITHICPAHWRPNRDLVTRAGTVVHEATHHAGAGDKRSPSTGRKVYAYRSVLRLAQEDVFLAQHNAQSLRYLVWDLARHEQ